MTTGIANNVSARNQISGTIANIQKGAAMSVVTVSANGHTITSAITNGAVEDLGLKKNDAVVALVKATEALIAKGDMGTMKVSARNKISGRVTDIRKGPAMASVTVDAGELKLTTGDYNSSRGRSAVEARRSGYDVLQGHRGNASEGLMRTA